MDVNSVGGSVLAVGIWVFFFPSWFYQQKKDVPVSVVLDTDTNQTKILIVNRPYKDLNKVPRNRQTRKLPEKLLTLNRSGQVSKVVYNKIRPRHKQPP